MTVLPKMQCSHCKHKDGSYQKNGKNNDYRSFLRRLLSLATPLQQITDINDIKCHQDFNNSNTKMLIIHNKTHNNSFREPSEAALDGVTQTPARPCRPSPVSECRQTKYIPNHTKEAHGGHHSHCRPIRDTGHAVRGARVAGWTTATGLRERHHEALPGNILHVRSPAMRAIRRRLYRWNLTRRVLGISCTSPFEWEGHDQLSIALLKIESPLQPCVGDRRGLNCGRKAILLQICQRTGD